MSKTIITVGKNHEYDLVGPPLGEGVPGALNDQDVTPEQFEKYQRMFPNVRVRRWSDSGLAERVIDLYGDRIRYNPAFKTHYVWNEETRLWQETDHGAFVHLVGKVITEHLPCEDLFYSEAKVERGGKLVSERDDFRRWRRSVDTEARFNAVARFLTSFPELRITLDDFDKDPWTLNTPNGVIDMRERSRSPRPAEPGDMLTRVTGVGIDEVGTEPFEFEKFLHLVQPNPEHRKYLQVLLGMAAYGDPGEHMFVFHQGEGGNGKGVLLRLLNMVLGDYYRTASRTGLTVAGNTFEESTWPGVRLLVGDEMGNADLDQNKLKDLTGGGQIMANAKHKPHAPFTPRFSLHLCGNEWPTLANTDSIERRYRPVAWTVKPSSDEWAQFQRNGQKDPADYLFEEEGEQILSWILAGYLTYRVHGLNVPQDLQDMAAEQLLANDSVTLFATSCLVADDGWDDDSADGCFKISQKEMYSQYKRWCRQAGHTAQGVKQFNRDLRKCASGLGFAHNASRGRPAWVGVRYEESDD
ncbi:DNA primase family protein [Streptomyces sp. NBC_00483]|uniref:DNA primase family protein n=1 Tax=Streptomyces sp. NBC_00483 TaxID=2975756 RepID=UPI002E1795F0